jgi:NAD(P)-dependent dehydrogenase (short-subunit alcohol dehydrogenase family)
MSGIDGKSALVTGGGSGIGLASAIHLAAEGAHVTICGRTESKLEGAVEQIRAAAAPGVTVAHIVADVTIEDQINAAVAKASEPVDGLDILFANAGGSYHMGPMESSDVEALRSTVDLNLVGTYLCIKAAIPAMRRRGGGSIIGMSSGAGHFPHRMLWAYGASKAGIDMLCKYAAEELGKDGIRVNSVQPGIVDDDLMKGITAGGPLMDDYTANMPLERAGTVEDIAHLVRFLAGPESSWITGENFAIDGGHHLRAGANYGLLFGSPQ